MIPKVLLFDLGGVLVEWAGIAAVSELTGGRMDIDATRKFWLECPWIRKFERGLCGEEDYFAGMVQALGLDMTPEEYHVTFVSWERGPIPGSIELLDQLRSRFTLACLSNNNPVHWERIRDGIGSKFDHTFISYEMGMMKPDAAAYRHVIERIGCRPEEILFFDDSPECIDGAAAAGIRGHVVQGLPGVLNALESEGINVDVTRLGVESVQRAD